MHLMLSKGCSREGLFSLHLSTAGNSPPLTAAVARVVPSATHTPSPSSCPGTCFPLSYASSQRPTMPLTCNCFAPLSSVSTRWCIHVQNQPGVCPNNGSEVGISLSYSATTSSAQLSSSLSASCQGSPCQSSACPPRSAKEFGKALPNRRPTCSAVCLDRHRGDGGHDSFECS